MCPGTGSVPLHLPYLEERLYYINGFHSGPKHYGTLENPLYTSLSACQKRLLSYELRMESPSAQALPIQVSLQVKPTLAIIVNP